MRSTSIFAVLASVVAPFALTPGCRRDEAPPAPAPAASASADALDAATAAAAAAASAGKGADEVKPVYPVLQGEPEPAARKLCAALHELPNRRRAECCAGGASSSLAAVCEGVVTAALRSGAVALDDAAVDRCAQAMDRAHQGCDWVTPLSSDLPAECEGLLAGRFAEGDRCRSSLECAEGLRCHGAGPTSAGRCGKPREGGACNTGVDVLATYARQAHYDQAHPECAGVCSQHRCQPTLAAGAACKASAACGAGSRCVAGHCVAKAPKAEGETCKDALDCDAGLHCAGGVCQAKGGEGAACERDLDCRGVCLKSKGQAKGVCGHRCNVDWLSKAR
ncbi:MAG TPA: hypothetical protein VFS43_29930 [Polyangiaceae bacterium]|nr:hypothetical protein [Polyangiaceae bacterium]